MDEVRNNLSKEQKAYLRNLWEDKDTLHSLSNALSQQQLILQHRATMAATDYAELADFRGQVKGLMWVISFLKHNHKKMKAAEQAIVDESTASRK